ncbi:MAG TPA: ABC transporter ATP-binding protein, partial [Burkholderiales bacterium]|nr:ABC transporter ATP-binding protein [Burkholderiales bacterium]
MASPLPSPSAAPTMLRVRGLARYFDASAPLLDRVLRREPRRLLRAVDGVDFEIARGQTLSLVGES